MPRLPRLGALLALVAPALTGCISVMPQALSSSELSSYADAVNARRGTNLPGRMTLTGVGVGLTAFGGIFGIEGALLKGASSSEDATGQTQTLRARVQDLKLQLAYPAKIAGPVVLAPGVDWIHRTTQVDGAEETAFVLRPKLMVVLGVGKLAFSPQVGYDVPLLVNDELGLNTSPGRPAKAGMPGFFAGFGFSYGCGC